MAQIDSTIIVPAHKLYFELKLWIQFIFLSLYYNWCPHIMKLKHFRNKSLEKYPQRYLLFGTANLHLYYLTHLMIVWHLDIRNPNDICNFRPAFACLHYVKNIFISRHIAHPSKIYFMLILMLWQFLDTKNIHKNDLLIKFIMEAR